MNRRILAIALSFAALYAVVLGAGASAQDPTPSSTAEAAATADETATPFASPVETVLAPSATFEPESTPEKTSTPEETSTPEKTSTPEETSTPAQTSTPSQTSTPDSTPSNTPGPKQTQTPSATPTATPEKQQGERDVTPDDRDRDLVDAIGEACADSRITRAERRRLEAEGSIEGGESLAEICGAIRESGKGKRGKAERVDREKLERVREVTERLRRAASKVKSPKPTRNADGTPTLDHPSYATAEPGAAPIGVPNFFIDKFRIPPFLLSIYQAAGMEYGVRWEVLAAINEIETDYGRNLAVSSAGALGWMQFMPATWAAYGVDANGDGEQDPFNPVDAIFAAARYLKAAGAETDLRRAIFAYNHADWYVDSVLLRAQAIGGLPANFVGSLTGLTQARFPVWAKSTYAGEVTAEDTKTLHGSDGAVSNVVEGAETRRDIRIFARDKAPVIAVNDGKIVRIGQNARLGRFVKLQDVYGNTFTYGGLASVEEFYPYPKARKVSDDRVRRELDLPEDDAAPKRAASSTSVAASEREPAAKPAPEREKAATLPAPMPAKERLFANPARPNAYKAGGKAQLAAPKAPRRGSAFTPIAGGPLKVTAEDYVSRPLEKGSRVLAGTVLGRIGKVEGSGEAAHVRFEIRPAGRGAPRIDPKPILDGWKLLESTAIYRAAGKNPFFGKDAKAPTIGQILLMSKETLVRRVLQNPRIDIYGCGREDVRTGGIDRRVLATLEFLAASGLRPTVTSLKCGHGYYTASGNVSHHSSGNAVDIAAVNGIPMIGNQGQGSITDIAVQRLLTLQGTLKPDQIITLMTYEGADNTYAMADHHDHIHVGWRPLYGTNSKAAKQVNAVLEPDQWIKLIDRLNAIDNPTVRLEPSKYAVKVDRASKAHVGD